MNLKFEILKSQFLGFTNLFKQYPFKDAGRISHEQAQEKASQEYKKDQQKTLAKQRITT